MRIAIIGLPNSTKTTVFNALTRGNLETAAYSSGALDVRSATAEVPDPPMRRSPTPTSPGSTAAWARVA